MSDVPEGALRLEPHPARADVHGVQVEAFPDYRQVMCGKARVAYVGAPGATGYGLGFIAAYPEEFVNLVVDFCKRQGCIFDAVGIPPSIAALDKLRQEADAEEDDDDLQ